jgi:hypothetical protein
MNGPRPRQAGATRVNTGSTSPTSRGISRAPAPDVGKGAGSCCAWPRRGTGKAFVVVSLLLCDFGARGVAEQQLTGGDKWPP